MPSYRVEYSRDARLVALVHNYSRFLDWGNNQQQSIKDATGRLLLCILILQPHASIIVVQQYLSQQYFSLKVASYSDPSSTDTKLRR